MAESTPGPVVLHSRWYVSYYCKQQQCNEPNASSVSPCEQLRAVMSTPPVVQAVLPCKLMSLRTCACICAQPVHTHSCQTRHAAICSGAHDLSCSFKTVCMLQVLEPFLVWACCVSSAGTELMAISCGVHLHLGVSSYITFCRQHRLAVQSANCLHRPSVHSANYLHVLVSVSALCSF